MCGPLVKSVITLACHAGIRGSSPLRTATIRGLAKSGKAPALGAGDRRFDSSIPDQTLINQVLIGRRPASRKCLIYKGFLETAGSWDFPRKPLIYIGKKVGVLSRFFGIFQNQPL